MNFPGRFSKTVVPFCGASHAALVAAQISMEGTFLLKPSPSSTPVLTATFPGFDSPIPYMFVPQFGQNSACAGMPVDVRVDV